MKKFLLFILMIVISMTIMARPHHGDGFHHGGGFTHYGRWDMHYTPSMGYGHSHYHHGGLWGRGGRNFWPGFVGGVVGSVVVETIAPRSTVVLSTPATTVVPTTTVVQPTTVVYPTAVDQPYNSTYVTQPVNGYQTIQQTTTIVQPQRRWIEGHYEVREFGEGPNLTGMNIWIPGHWE